MIASTQALARRCFGSPQRAVITVLVVTGSIFFLSWALPKLFGLALTLLTIAIVVRIAMIPFGIKPKKRKRQF